MNQPLEVAILAGGYGTRLKGLWAAPKCLAPVVGVPLLLRLLHLCAELQPRHITLLLGFKSHLVKAALCSWLDSGGLAFGIPIKISVEELVRGTACAVREATFLRAPLLLLNGDTLPGYSLQNLVDIGADRTTSVITHRDGVYAGAALLNDQALTYIRQSMASDLDRCLFGLLLHGDVKGCRVEDFLDIGTRENFLRAQKAAAEADLWGRRRCELCLEIDELRPYGLKRKAMTRDEIIREIAERALKLRDADGKYKFAQFCDVQDAIKAALADQRLVPPRAKDEMPLRCRVVDGVIDMSIGVNILRFATESHPDFWDERSNHNDPNIKITDAAVFAKEVVYTINKEAEDGSTMLTRMLDEAIKQTIENGCEGASHDQGT